MNTLTYDLEHEKGKAFTIKNGNCIFFSHIHNVMNFK